MRLTPFPPKWWWPTLWLLMFGSWCLQTWTLHQTRQTIALLQQQLCDCRKAP